MIYVITLQLVHVFIFSFGYQTEIHNVLIKIHNVQVNLIITLSLGSMKTDRVISEPCYNEVIYNRHIAK